jgi:hypothetical protein
VDFATYPCAIPVTPIDLFRAFPFFSEEGDKPSAFPERYWKDRDVLDEQLQSFYLDPMMQDALKKDSSYDAAAFQLLGDPRIAFACR